MACAGLANVSSGGFHKNDKGQISNVKVWLRQALAAVAKSCLAAVAISIVLLLKNFLQKEVFKSLAVQEIIDLTQKILSIDGA